MIWLFLEALAAPDGYAITYRNGEFYISDDKTIKTKGIKVRG